MIKVHKKIFIGDESDYEQKVKGKDGWAVVHACKEPYHRNLLGYSGRGAPKNHPDYLFAERGNRFFMNIVDANNPKFFAEEMINAGIEFIQEKLDEGFKVLIHCNEGQSRGPSIGLLYLAMKTKMLSNSSFHEAENQFKDLYPSYNPKKGIRGHLIDKWNNYLEKWEECND